jgi:hypothetical protein
MLLCFVGLATKRTDTLQERMNEWGSAILRCLQLVSVKDAAMCLNHNEAQMVLQ